MKVVVQIENAVIKEDDTGTGMLIQGEDSGIPAVYVSHDCTIIVKDDEVHIEA